MSWKKCLLLAVALGLAITARAGATGEVPMTETPKLARAQFWGVLTGFGLALPALEAEPTMAADERIAKFLRHFQFLDAVYALGLTLRDEIAPQAPEETLRQSLTALGDRLVALFESENAEIGDTDPDEVRDPSLGERASRVRAQYREITSELKALTATVVCESRL